MFNFSPVVGWPHRGIFGLDTNGNKDSLIICCSAVLTYRTVLEKSRGLK